jgi:NDP-sugar pyrophosphorylase family protein
MMKKLKTAVVLAGGAGLRLSPLTNDRPKVMVTVLGKPILEWIIEWLRFNGFQNLIIGVAYKKECIMEYFGDGYRFGVKIKYSIHSVKGETGEGFRLAITRYVNDRIFLAMNGDEITNFKLEDMISDHLRHNVMATMAVTNPRCPFGVVRVDENRSVQSFDEKPIIPSLLVNIGVYIFDRNIVKYLPEKGPIEKTTFPLLAKKKLLRVYKINGNWLTINTLKDLEYAEKVLKKGVKDGTWLR